MSGSFGTGLLAVSYCSPHRSAHQFPEARCLRAPRPRHVYDGPAWALTPHRSEPFTHFLKTTLSDLGHLAGFLGAWGVRRRLQATINDAQGILARQYTLVNERLEQNRLQGKSSRRYALGSFVHRSSPLSAAWRRG